MYRYDRIKTKEELLLPLKIKMENNIDNADRLMKHCKGTGAKLHTVAFGPSTEVTEIIRKFF